METMYLQNLVPSYTEDATYHGHGNRVFVDENATDIPSTWKLTDAVAPAGQKAYMLAYLMNQAGVAGVPGVPGVPGVGALQQ
jgi:hypothetical protein